MKLLLFALTVITIFSVIYSQPETNIEEWQPISEIKYSNSNMVGESCSKCHSVANNDIIVLVEHVPLRKVFSELSI